MQIDAMFFLENVRHQKFATDQYEFISLLRYEINLFQSKAKQAIFYHEIFDKCIFLLIFLLNKKIEKKMHLSNNSWLYNITKFK